MGVWSEAERRAWRGEPAQAATGDNGEAMTGDAHEAQLRERVAFIRAHLATVPADLDD